MSFIILASQDLNDGLKFWAPYIALGFICLIIILLGIYYLSVIAKKKKKSGDENKLQDNFVQLMGGSDNIISKSMKGSRFTIQVKDNTLIKQNELKQIGVDNIIIMSDKIVLVINKKSIEKFKKISLN